MWINDVFTRALLDTGSMVSTVSESLCSKLNLKICDLSGLLVTSASNHTIDYLGYIEVTISVRKTGKAIPVLLLVVPDTQFHASVPVLLGTNALKDLLQFCNPPLAGWQMIQSVLKRQQELEASPMLGEVRVRHRMVVPPEESVVVQTYARIASSCQQLLVMVDEPWDNGLPGGLQVASSVHYLPRGCQTLRIPVRVSNSSKRQIVLQRDSRVAEVQQVAMVPPVPEVCASAQTVSVGQVVCDEDKSKLEGQLSSDVPSSIRKPLLDLLWSYRSVFSWNDLDLGHTDMVKHEINLVHETPFKERHRRIPPAMVQEVRSHLAEMLELGVIRPSQSPYASNVVLVKKKDGSLRFCIDLRRLNAITVRDSYALPRIDETLDALHGAKWFSVLDLRSGYWNVEISERDKHKTAFTLGPLGFFECNRMCFGLTNAPATFQRLMNMCMGDLHLQTCLLYLDDTIVFSRSPEEHLSRLSAVLERLQKAGLKLRLDKCHFVQKSIKFLGHVVSGEGVAMDPNKITAVRDWPTPTTVKELKRFLGFVSFYRRFVKGFAKIASCLHKLTEGDQTKASNRARPLVWLIEHQEAFETLRAACCSAPVLAFADFDSPFLLHTDASGVGLGAILYQVQDGVERPIAYASRCLNKSEKHYPAHKLEFLALKWAVCDKFHDYLYGNNFHVRTDNNPLTYVLSSAKLDAAGHRWVSQLASYNFDLEYRSGRSNGDADALSRIEWPQTVAACCESVHAVLQSSSCEEPLVSCFAVTGEVIPEAESSELRQVTLREMAEAQDAELALAEVKQAIQDAVENPRFQTTGSRLLWRYIKQLKVRESVLYKVSSSAKGDSWRLVLPTKFHAVALRGVHDEMGHLGRDRSLALLQARFYWPGMIASLAEHIAQCRRCIQRKTPDNQRASLVNITSSQPLELLCVDFLSLEPSKGGVENILVITDHFTRYAQAYPAKNQTAYTTARLLYENFVVHYGFPARLHSDQGRNFESKLISELCKVAGVRKSHTTPYHPMGNGQVERFNRTLLGMLGTLDTSQKHDWKVHVPSLVFAYNSTKNDTTGLPLKVNTS